MTVVSKKTNSQRKASQSSSGSPVFPVSIQIGITALAGFMILALIRSLFHSENLLIGGFNFNRLTCALGSMVSIVGAVVVNYTKRYLYGDERQNSFTKFLALSITSALCVILADNLFLIVLGWAVTSVGLHFLLTHYRSLEDAHIVTQKKFLISRLGDLALLMTLLLIYNSYGTLSLTQFFVQMELTGTPPTATVFWICVAAITKSAQFPFHTWLPDTLCSPNPVSALMHAGIINGGGALLLKFSPALVQVPLAGLFLSIIGSMTMAIGLLSMWSQTSIKRKLAWSTVSQMGFMTAECGMAAFVAAFIHILGHGLYKATAFLDSGSIEPRGAPIMRLSGSQTVVLLLIGGVLTLPIQMLLHSGGEMNYPWAVMILTSLASGHLIVEMYKQIRRTTSGMITWSCMVAGSQLMALVATLLLIAASKLIPFPSPHKSLTWMFASALPVATLIALSVYRAFEEPIKESAIGRSVYLHSQNGFYIGLFADRLVSKIWKPLRTKN